MTFQQKINWAKEKLVQILNYAKAVALKVVFGRQEIRIPMQIDRSDPFTPMLTELNINPLIREIDYSETIRQHVMMNGPQWIRRLSAEITDRWEDQVRHHQPWEYENWRHHTDNHYWRHHTDNHWEYDTNQAMLQNPEGKVIKFREIEDNCGGGEYQYPWEEHRKKMEEILEKRDDEYDFRCPIGQEPLIDPILSTDQGGNRHCYERKRLQAWIRCGRNTDPLTRGEIPTNEFMPSDKKRLTEINKIISEENESYQMRKEDTKNGSYQMEIHSFTQAQVN